MGAPSRIACTLHGEGLASHGLKLTAIGVTILIRCLLVEWDLLRGALCRQQVWVDIVLLLEFK